MQLIYLILKNHSTNNVKFLSYPQSYPQVYSQDDAGIFGNVLVTIEIDYQYNDVFL